MSILIKSATLVDSKSNLNFKKKDILIKDGVIVDIADTIDTNASQIFDFENESTDFDAGDILSWSIDPTNTVNYVAATIVLALDPSNNY